MISPAEPQTSRTLASLSWYPAFPLVAQSLTHPASAVEPLLTLMAHPIYPFDGQKYVLSPQAIRLPLAHEITSYVVEHLDIKSTFHLGLSCWYFWNFIQDNSVCEKILKVSTLHLQPCRH